MLIIMLLFKVHTNHMQKSTNAFFCFVLQNNVAENEECDGAPVLFLDAKTARNRNNWLNAA